MWGGAAAGCSSPARHGCSRPRGGELAGAAEAWAQRDPRPTDPAPRGGKERKGTPCSCGSSEREVGPGWAAVPGSPGWEAAGSRAARLPGAPGQGSPGAGVTGARAAARRPTHVCGWKGNREARGWERDRVCASTDVTGAANAGRPAARGPALRPGPASRRRPAPLRCLPGCPSSLELPLLPAPPREPAAVVPSGKDEIRVLFAQS